MVILENFRCRTKAVLMAIIFIGNFISYPGHFYRISMSFHVVGQKLIDIGSFVTNLDKWVAVGMFCI